MTTWLSITIGAVLTYLIRASFIAFSGKRPLPPQAQRFLTYVGPAAFAAIVAPLVFVDEATDGVSLDERVVAVAVGALVMWRTKNLIAMLASGMATLWLVDWLGLLPA